VAITASCWGTGEKLQGMKKNIELLHDSKKNKSTAFTKEEREKYGLRGLLPYAVSTQQTQIERILQNISLKTTDLEKYILLTSLQDRNERLFYKLVTDHLPEILPLIYTPTVGQACKEFSHIFRQTKGFYITPEDKGQIRRMLDNWPEDDIQIIVVTDGQRILGLGDLGANGMGIPIGKLSLYTACGGVKPSQCLPVMLDVGTNNMDLRNNSLYIGYPHERITGDEYFKLVEEFVNAIQDKFPNALIQFEDFLTPNAFGLLKKYKHRVLSFNDDIQGTAAVALAGVYASTRITKMKFSDLRILFLGAGSAATGIADLMVAALEAEGLSNEEARKRMWFADRKGLLVAGRSNIMEHSLIYAHEHRHLSFLDAIEEIKPHVLIGATGSNGAFTQEVIERMSKINERPVIFALSNPTANAECTAEQAYTWSLGKAVFASGSPFKEVIYNGRRFTPGQGNNAYIFPGMGLGAITCGAKKIPEDFFFTAARMLAALVSEKDIERGALYPPLTEIRRISVCIAVAVAEKAYQMGLARNEKPGDLEKHILKNMYDPAY
jgi:malate dehydrogenase (oxaloacetate-decarboxylating)(NADP+)